ncbi:MAG: PAS domain-containing protein [Phaeodactylibacter sp.]|uniref:PAS domain-containing protein n=1 Tax=Phaeodactylibacter sp. TaxID=1940289 RepID=UPI0032EFDA63
MKNHYLKQELYQLIQSDQQIFDFLQEASLDGLWYWDLDQPEEEWMSPKFWRTLGYEPKEMPHKSNAWQDIIHPDDLETAKQNLEAHLLDPNHPYDQEVRYQHKKGYTVWVRCRGLAIRNEEGRPIRMLGAHNNITRLKETEARLKRENRQLNAVLGNSGLYIINTDLDGKFTFFNQKFKNDFGWHPFVALGKDSIPSIHPQDHDACISVVQQCFKFPYQAFQVDLRKPKKTGGWQTNRWNFSAQVDSKGNPDSILCIGYDISLKKQIEREYKLLVDNIGDALITTDLEGGILYTSKSWSSNLNQENATGRPIVDFCFADDQPKLQKLITGVSEGSLKAHTLDHRLKSATGHPLWVETKCNLDTDGNRLIFLIRDISERKQAEDKLYMTTQLLNETQQMAKVGGWKLEVKTGHTFWTEEVFHIHEVPLTFEHNKEAGISFYHPDDQQVLADALKQTIEQKTSFDQAFQFITAKGNPKWVRVTGKPVIQAGEVTEIQGLFQDITDQKKALMELNRSQEQLASLTANVPGAVLQYKINTDQSEELLYISNGALDIWGIEPNDAFQNVSLLWEAMLPDYPEAVQKVIEASRQSLTTFSYDWQVRHTDGSIRWVNGKGSPKRLPDGSTVWNTLITDITTLKRTQQQLEEQGAMQKKLMHIASEYINIPIEEMDDRIQSSLEEIGRFVNADRAYVIQYDFAHEKASNTHEWCSPGIETVKDSLQNVPMESYQIFIDQHINGKIFTVRDSSAMEPGATKAELERQQIKSLITVPMMYEERCLGCVGFDSVKQAHEYTQRELELLGLFSEVLVNTLIRAATDQELRSRQEQLSKLTVSVPGAIYQMEMTTEGEISFPFVSEGISDLHPLLKPKELIKDPQLGFSLIHPEDLPKILTKIEMSRAELTPFHADYRIIWPNGEVKWQRAMSRPELRPDGTIVWYGIFQDTTEQRKLEQIQKFAQELEVKNKEMEQFTYVASHDLQEPLRTIRSYSGLLQRRFNDKLGEDGQQFLKFIGDASLRMSDLIKGLLEYSQIGNNREVSKIDCNELLEEILQDLNSSISHHHAEIEVAPLPTLEGYRLELRQLFQNLISNAIKFHQSGQSPKVEVNCTDQQGYWQFSVRDNGIGIHPMYQEKIFTIFQRLHLANEYDGTGIGLAHCKKIVEMHHGNIWLESTEGEGSTFFFTLKKGGYESEA